MSKRLQFVGEQIGQTENELKVELCRLFDGHARPLRAYLARVEYGGDKDPHVALCLRAEGGEDLELVDKVASVFSKMFGAHEHLDILFVTEGQEEDLRQTCCPFFQSPGFRYETPDFYLTSSEGYGLEEIRACFKARRLLASHPDGYLLCEIDPPILGQGFGLGSRDIHQVVLASRHVGYSIFNISEWPSYVHVAWLPTDVGEKFSLSAGDVTEIGWGELYKNRGDAERAANPLQTRH